MIPIEWAASCLDYLERIPIVGALLPRAAGLGTTDRYQPNRVSVIYAWAGPTGAATRVTFKIRAPDNRDTISETMDGWTITTRASETWGDSWEDVELVIPRGTLPNTSKDLTYPGRFSLRLTIEDEATAEEHWTRSISLENLRELGGILHSVRIHQDAVPDLVRMRPAGIDEDAYYRARGLIGTLSSEDHRLSFAPFALLPEPIRRPVLGGSLAAARERGLISETSAELLASRGIRSLYQFQEQAIQEIRSRIASAPNDVEAILLSGATGAGKTEAFLLPLLEHIESQPSLKGVQGLFVYPTKALGADQASRFFEFLTQINQHREHPVSIGVINGDTPWNRGALLLAEQAGEVRSPFSICPLDGCGGTVRFTIDREGSPLEVPTCQNCGAEYGWIRPTQTAIRERWPTLLLATPDMLHSLVSGNFAWSWQSMFGRGVHVCDECGRYTPTSSASNRPGRRCTECKAVLPAPDSLSPKIIVFDEAHLLKGLFGSQVAILISRLKQICRHHGAEPVFVGASATIADPEEFGRHLFGGDVLILRGNEELSDEPPTRYHLFLMPVQVTVLNAIGQILASLFSMDYERGEQNRVLVFSDSKRTVYTLEQSLTEFYAGLPEELVGGELELVATRSHTGDLAPDERRIRERAFNRSELRVLLATQTLEVGVDFDNLQLELQTGATYSYNDYIQRVGRAGRRNTEALVVCVLRPQVPLDYYYYEHCRELVQFSEEHLDEIPLRTDNPFLVEKHGPAVVQDFLVSYESAAGLVWNRSKTLSALGEERERLESYLRQVFVRPHHWDQDLLERAIANTIDRCAVALQAPAASSPWAVGGQLKSIVDLSVRSSDTQVAIESDGFESHQGISLAGRLEEEAEPEDDSKDEDIEEEAAAG